ncbi:MAG: AAA family ATPase, partial [Saprospiraceae bacterium]|nr:AAA family ATPase [Saprospiraceae bacterium]
MENNQENKNGTKFNPYWIYGVLALFFIGLNFLPITSSTSEPITFEKFATMAKEGDVDKLEVVNEKYAQVYLTEDAIKNKKDKYKDASKSSFANKRPHYTFDIGPSENFANKIDALNTTLPADKQVLVSYVEKANWLSPIISLLLPLALLVLLWIFIMRRVGGGAGGPGAQIFNIGKSKATLFDQNSKVNINFADVAGLDEAKEEVMEVVDFLK